MRVGGYLDVLILFLSSTCHRRTKLKLLPDTSAAQQYYDNIHQFAVSQIVSTACGQVQRHAATTGTTTQSRRILESTRYTRAFQAQEKKKKQGSKDVSKFRCVQLLATAITVSYVLYYNNPSDNVRPSYFLNTHYVEQIYVGTLYTYPQYILWFRNRAGLLRSATTSG